MYRIWFNGKPKRSEVLNNYENTDIGHTSENKLMKNEAYHGKQVYQINLMTKS